MGSMVSGNLHADTIVYVKAWWYADHRIVKCVTMSRSTIHREDFSSLLSGRTEYREEEFVDVKPMEGNPHSRFINCKDIVGSGASMTSATARR